MIPRHLAPHILRYAKEYPVVALVGPRQSGKTTLAKALFPNHRYLSLENLDLRLYAAEDPRGFLNDHGPNVILDEIQRVPEIFPYLQQLVDDDSTAGQYVLTGSSQFLLMEQITQSLAGRVITFKLYALSYPELCLYPSDTCYEAVFRAQHSKRERVNQEQLYELLLRGFYPRIHDRQLDSYKWYENYVLTYVERDIRSLLQVRNLRTFEAFLKLSATLSGQLLNFSSLSNSLGMSVPTIKEWISLLETSGIVLILQPYFKNFSKRIVKTPKLYFADPGLLCFLLSIRTTEHLRTHPLIGSIFETFLVSDCFKRIYNLGETPGLYFWRDQSGHKIDLIIDNGMVGYPLEFKLSQTFHSDYKKNIEHWLTLTGNPVKEGTVLYCGDHALNTKGTVKALPWYRL